MKLTQNEIDFLIEIVEEYIHAEELGYFLRYPEKIEIKDFQDRLNAIEEFQKIISKLETLKSEELK